MDALKALQSMGLGAELEGVDGEKLMEQAQQIWTMLDDMVDSDPEAYKRFIEKQTKEHQALMAPPEPHMSVMTNFQEGGVVYVNIMSWPKVPAPKSPQDSIPMFAAPLDIIPHGKKESASTIAITTNPDVLKESGVDAKNPEEQQEFIRLCLDYAEHLCKRKMNRNYTLLPKSTPFKGDLDKAQNYFVRSLKKAMNKNSSSNASESHQPAPTSPNHGSSLMDQLSNITLPNGKSQSQGEPRTSSIVPPIAVTDTERNKKQKPKTLIQEIGGEEAKLQEPVHQLEKSSSGDAFVLTVELSGVKSVSDCQLDISEDDVKLYVEGKYELTVALPSRIDDSEAQAKFLKKKSTLTLHMPVAKS